MEWVKIFLSWPVLTIVFFTGFSIAFRRDIGEFLRTNKLKGVGPIDVENKGSNQSPEPSESSDRADDLLAKEEKLDPKQLKKVETEARRLTKQLESANKEKSEKDEIIAYLSRRLEATDFKYLDKFLVTNSKLALKWVPKQGSSITRQQLIDYVATLTQKPEQPGIIFNVLKQNGLLERKGARYVISAKGRKFLNFMHD